VVWCFFFLWAGGGGAGARGGVMRGGGGGGGGPGPAAVKAACGLTERQAAKVAGRLSGAAVSFVADDKAALAALGL
jgi:hypothetical protein